MRDKLREVERKFEELTHRLEDPTLITDPKALMEVTRERARLEKVVSSFRELEQVESDLAGARELLEESSEEELREMAKAEIKELEPHVEKLERELQLSLLPRDPMDDKSVVLEIRAGAGGDEAALFAGELFLLYQRYAGDNGWRVEIMSDSPGTAGGFKEIIATVEGTEVYARMKYEAGVHRVQRVPQTESQGRVHTSTVTVAIMPEAEEVDVHIDDKDLRIDTMRASGHGGQSVNTTDSAVRIVHLPTNTMVVCRDEKSQHKNKAKAMKVLRARLYEVERERAAAATGEQRRSMVGTGDRSEKIRTYNFPQDRLTDHRINLTLYNLPKIMSGELGPVVTALRTHAQAELLEGEIN
ncbi:MAG: peptide chain release factor 1 [Myxococcales bacterium]|nr:peptide chain release factor 1 [Myxococcales bacterium]